MKPAGAPEWQVVGDAVGIRDLETVLDPRRQRRHEVGPAVVLAYVAEVVRDDDVVETLPVDPRVVQGPLSRQKAHVGGDEISVDVATFGDVGDLSELLDEAGVVVWIQRISIACVELPQHEVLVRYPLRRNVRAGTDDHRVPHLGDPPFAALGQDPASNGRRGLHSQQLHSM